MPDEVSRCTLYDQIFIIHMRPVSKIICALNFNYLHHSFPLNHYFWCHFVVFDYRYFWLSIFFIINILYLYLYLFFHLYFHLNFYFHFVFYFYLPQGLPVLTLKGESFPNRVGTSLYASISISLSTLQVYIHIHAWCWRESGGICVCVTECKDVCVCMWGREDYKKIKLK